MEIINPTELRQVVGNGTAQLLCETYIKIKPPMSKIIRELFTAEITDYTVFNDKVLVKGAVEHTFYYLHPHGKKSQDEQNEEGKKDRDSEASEEKTDEFKCLDGWGSLVECYGGIVHFHQQLFEFTGPVAIPGVIPGDVITGTAQVTDYDYFAACEIEPNGLISGGTQTFKIDVTLKATRD
ncbi:SPOCS domain-containing protein [Pelosinus sp. IPA-1]|uniref:SPOCS domain-containing protein n=1 Tax=Pelosinus sp. IPA-1 TaxID=3029569 RepID=UPI0024361E0D|nr:SPOCS domain-containing protein [Pelosinus sp. IPA-1]GMA97860.1 hypothetical protein PIPA1_06600 [Pelosinus sp. IPA-1]